MPGRKRKLSDNSSLQVPQEPKRERSRSPSLGAPSGVANIAHAVKGLFSKTPDPTDPVISGATFAAQPRPALGDFLRTIASQVGRVGDNASLVSSFIDTALFDGGYVDDKKYQVRVFISKVNNLANSISDGTDHSIGCIASRWNKKSRQFDRTIS
jgi:hypothetical protein